jgi:carboxyl-terminal processing protease
VFRELEYKLGESARNKDLRNTLLFCEFSKLQKGVVPNAKQIAISRNFLLTQLKSYITRNIQGDEGFYPLYYKNDKTVLKALEVIRKQK